MFLHWQVGSVLFFNHYFNQNNYYTILCCFLTYINTNQPQVYMCPPLLNPPPTSIPTLSLGVVPEYRLWVPCVMHGT